MSEPTKTTAAPRRTGTRTAKPAAAKTAPAKAKASAPTAAPANPPKFTVDGVQGNDTKSYSVFNMPEGSGCVGKVYAPLGAVAVKVLVVMADGPADSE